MSAVPTAEEAIFGNYVSALDQLAASSEYMFLQLNIAIFCFLSKHEMYSVWDLSFSIPSYLWLMSVTPHFAHLSQDSYTCCRPYALLLLITHYIKLLTSLRCYCMTGALQMFVFHTRTTLQVVHACNC